MSTCFPNFFLPLQDVCGAAQFLAQPQSNLLTGIQAQTILLFYFQSSGHQYCGNSHYPYHLAEWCVDSHEDRYRFSLRVDKWDSGGFTEVKGSWPKSSIGPRGWVFWKWPMNVQNTPSRCGFLRSWCNLASERFFPIRRDLSPSPTQTNWRVSYP